MLNFSAHFKLLDANLVCMQSCKFQTVGVGEVLELLPREVKKFLAANKLVQHIPSNSLFTFNLFRIPAQYQVIVVKVIKRRKNCVQLEHVSHIPGI